MTRITRRAPVLHTKWFTLNEKYVTGNDEPFYSIATLDYVTTVAVTPEHEMLFVRQYRPAVEDLTLELPSGHVDEGETPEAAARRELLEETGYEAVDIELMGSLVPDSGRLENRMWCFYASRVQSTAVQPEAGLELVKTPVAAVRQLVANGQLLHALNVAAVMLTVSRSNSFAHSFIGGF